jgi:hypothetical protein
MSLIKTASCAIAVVLALSTGARAEDWSQFIDNSPQKPIAVKPTVTQQRPVARPAKAVAAKPKVATKARAKSKTRR